jgi:hypothetical protein
MSESLLEFPCDFPLKVMGRKSEDFRELVVRMVAADAGPLDDGQHPDPREPRRQFHRADDHGAHREPGAARRDLPRPVALTTKC